MGSCCLSEISDLARRAGTYQWYRHTWMCTLTCRQICGRRGCPHEHTVDNFWDVRHFSQLWRSMHFLFASMSEQLRTFEEACNTLTQMPVLIRSLWTVVCSVRKAQCERKSQENKMSNIFDRSNLKASLTRRVFFCHEQVQKFCAQNFTRFYKKHYQPSKMHLFLVGDINVEDSILQIQKTFGKRQNTIEEVILDTPPGLMHTWPVRGTAISHRFGKTPTNRTVAMAHPQINEFSVSSVLFCPYLCFYLLSCVFVFCLSDRHFVTVSVFSF